MLITSDIHDNDVTINALDDKPRVIATDKDTVVVALAQDEVLVLIEDLARSAWSGGTHLVIEADKITYPKREEAPA